MVRFSFNPITNSRMHRVLSGPKLPLTARIRNSVAAGRLRYVCAFGAMAAPITAAATVIVSMLPGCGSAELGASGNSAFTNLLLGEGYPLGETTLNISTEEAAGKIVNLQIPINIEKDYSEGLMNLQLMLRLSTDFADFPVYITGWDMEIEGESFTSPANFAEQLINGGPGTEVVLDLPRELNSSGVIWPTTIINVKLRGETVNAPKKPVYPIAFNAVLQGME